MFESIIKKCLSNATVTIKGTAAVIREGKREEVEVDMTITVRSDESSDRTMRSEPPAPSKK